MVARSLRLILACARLNLAAAMEYRAAFISQCIGMILNNSVMMLFWLFYFDRFPGIEGWSWREVILLWGIVATSAGLGLIVFGNCIRLATLIAEGQLDYYLTMPRNLLLHVLVSRMSLSAWGDFSFGVVALVIGTTWLGPASLPLAVLLVLLSCATFVAFAVILGSLAFFIGNAEAAALQGREAALNFSLYPGPIFHGWVKVVLMTAIPAGFIAHIPVEVLRDFDPGLLAALAGFAALIWAVALSVFAAGLRRYESGNLVVLRG
jgi:ABC-2 type transport system permease protein